jgi:hypothetical protein
MKPKGLAETTLAMGIMNIAGFVFVDPQVAPVEIQYAIFGINCAYLYRIMAVLEREKLGTHIGAPYRYCGDLKSFCVFV